MNFTLKIFAAILLFNFNMLYAEGPITQLVEEYIDQYKSISVTEMHRSGIPASIKLAQGILESNIGRSPLAYEANNHFGIKCGAHWQGQTFHKPDDDYDKNGNLIESCFRAYSDSYESYIAHSDFLTDSNKNYRYGFLFELNSLDYKKWAKGLLKAGYATDKKYPSKLIQIIKQYNLHQYDRVPENTIDHHYANHSEEAPEAYQYKSNSKGNQNFARRSTYQKRSTNTAKMVVLQKKETVLSLSKKLRINYRKIIRYNEEIHTKDQALEIGEIVYLSKKPKKLLRGKAKHIVAEGDNMYSISQKYGVDLKSLYRLNDMTGEDRIDVGMTISLKNKISSNRAQQSSLSSQEVYLFEPDWANKDK